MTTTTIRSYGIDADIESKKQTIADVIDELMTRHAKNDLVHRD
jgi:hypothetical protein